MTCQAQSVSLSGRPARHSHQLLTLIRFWSGVSGGLGGILRADSHVCSESDGRTTAEQRKARRTTLFGFPVPGPPSPTGERSARPRAHEQVVFCFKKNKHRLYRLFLAILSRTTSSRKEFLVGWEKAQDEQVCRWAIALLAKWRRRVEQFVRLSRSQAVARRWSGRGALDGLIGDRRSCPHGAVHQQ